MSHAVRYSLSGALLGLGAPAGALLIRFLQGASPAVELHAHAFFYVYEFVGTCLIFSVVGFFAGRRADRFRKGRDLYRELSEHDPLTNLANSRAFWGRYDRAVEHARRFGEPLSLLLIDIDGLKAINDELGHAFGSAALEHVGRILEDTKRTEDTAARWGGDEFGVLMLGAGEDAARRQSEAILDALRREPVRLGGRERSISATVGAATAEGGQLRDLFDAADRALYAGKKAGRRQVQLAHDGSREGNGRPSREARTSEK